MLGLYKFQAGAAIAHIEEIVMVAKSTMSYTFFAILIAAICSQQTYGSILEKAEMMYESAISNLTPGAQLPDTGYWNYLLIAGLYGRMLHYLLTNSNGFGEQIKLMEHMYKGKIGDKKYVELEQYIADTYPIFDTLFQLTQMSEKLWDIEDPITHKTFGYALTILNNLQKDQRKVDEFVKKLKMIEKPAEVFKNPTNDGQIKSLKITLLENPDLFMKLLSDPEILRRATSTILSDFDNVDFMKGLLSVEELVLMLKGIYKEKFDTITGDLFSIVDNETALSFGESIKTIVNIVKTPEFKSKLNNVLNSPEVKSFRQQSSNLVNAAIVSGPEGFIKEMAQSITPANLKTTLASFGITVSEEKARDLIDKAISGTVKKCLVDLISETDRDGGLTPENVAEHLRMRNIFIDPSRIAQIANIVANMPPQMIIRYLDQTGKVIPVNVIVEFQEALKELGREEKNVEVKVQQKIHDKEVAETEVEQVETTSSVSSGLETENQ